MEARLDALFAMLLMCWQKAVGSECVRYFSMQAAHVSKTIQRKPLKHYCKCAVDAE